MLLSMMRRVWLVVVVVCSSVLLWWCTSREVQTTIDEVLVLKQAEQYAYALELLDRALVLYPNDQELLSEKAVLLMDTSEYEAFVDMRWYFSAKTIEQHPELLYRYAVSLLKTGNIWWAKDVIEQQLAEDRRADWLQLMGQLLYYQGDMDGAIQYYDEAIGIDPDNLDALMNKAIALADQGMLYDSLDLFDALGERYPDNYLIWYNKGTVLSDLGFQQRNSIGTGAFSMFADALRHFEQAYKLNPDYVYTIVRIGVTHYDLGQYQKALDILDVALSQDPTLLDALYYKGKVYLAQWYTGDARETFETILDMDETYALAEEELLLLSTVDW